MIAVEPVRIARGPAAGDEKALRLATEVGAIAVASSAAHGYGCQFRACWSRFLLGRRLEKSLGSGAFGVRRGAGTTFIDCSGPVSVVVVEVVAFDSSASGTAAGGGRERLQPVRRRRMRPWGERGKNDSAGDSCNFPKRHRQ